MKNPIEKLKELWVNFGDLLDNEPKKVNAILTKFFVGMVISLWGGVILYGAVSVGLRNKQDKDFANGKFNPSIKEANVLSVSGWTDTIKLDINGNGKFDKGDISFIDKFINKDSKSVVYIDGVNKKKPLAYQRENGEYVIYRDTTVYLKDSENLNKEFYDYMSDKKVFDLVKAKEEIRAHTK